MRTKTKPLLVALVACALIASACSSGADEIATAQEQPVEEQPVQEQPAAAEVNSDGAVLSREQALDEIVAETGVEREDAECIFDGLVEAAGGSYTDEALDAIEESTMERIAIDCISMDLFEDALVAAFDEYEYTVEDAMEAGYSEAEAACIAPLISSETSARIGEWETPVEAETRVQREASFAEALSACATPRGPLAGAAPLGIDSALDVLWADCNAGSGANCHRLYMESEIGSDYETFAETCGGRTVAEGSVNCGRYLDGVASDGYPVAGSPPPPGFPELDALWVQCDADGGQACLELFEQAPSLSAHSSFAYSCGGRDPDWNCLDELIEAS